MCYLVTCQGRYTVPLIFYQCMQKYVIFGYMSARVYNYFNILLLYAKEWDISLHANEGIQFL